MCAVLISGMVEARQFLVKTKNGDSASVKHFLARTKSKKHAMQRNNGDPVTSHHRIRKTRLEDPRIFPKKKENYKRQSGNSGKFSSEIVKGHGLGHDYVNDTVTNHHKIRKTNKKIHFVDPRIFPKKKMNDKMQSGNSGKFPSKIVKGHGHGHDYVNDPVNNHHEIRNTNKKRHFEDPRIFPKKKVNEKRQYGNSGKFPSKIVKGLGHGHDYVYEEVKDTSEDLKEADYDHSSHVTALCQVILSIGYSSLPCYIMHVFILFRQTQLRNLPVALGGIYKLYL